MIKIMKMFFRLKKYTVAATAISATLFAAACQQPNSPISNTNTNHANSNAVTTATPAAPTPSPAAANNRSEANLPVTLPVLDAMFAEESFANELKAKLNLTDEQIEKLRSVSREAVTNLNESEDESGSTAGATRRAQEQIRGILGEEKTVALSRFVRERWEQGGFDENGVAQNQKPNAIPTDTRIVVNAPAYRMDIFRDGQLVRTYKIGIGYPEFPLPSGMRKADTIIFNPTWTPPDEPWVKGKVAPGKKVEAGSKLNPLGPLKIPIGLPSLIHGGKNPARLGTFASHGCVGLTDAQVQEFAVELAQLSGMNLTPEDVKNYEKNKTETKNVKLDRAVPVELRYETIVVEDGKLKIYRDVYERGTNTEENLRRVLDSYGVSFDSLSEQERAQALNALQQMARDPEGNPADPSTAPDANSNNSKNNKNVKETKTIKGAKEATVEIAALQGKGYPAPVNLNAGNGANAMPVNQNKNQPSGAKQSAGSSRRF